MRGEDVVPAVSKIMAAQVAEVREWQRAVAAAEQELYERQKRLRSAFAELLPIPGGAVVAAGLRGGVEPAVTVTWDGERLVVAVEAGDFKATRYVSEIELRGWFKELGVQ